MRKVVALFLVLFIFLIFSSYISYSVPDADADGVPDNEDKCLKDNQEPTPGQENILWEVYCDSMGASQIEKYNCPNGCQDGACIS